MPDFPPLPFEQMSEADVREEVLVPLISALGYRTGTAFDIRRELSLRYPQQSLGRKQGTKDPVLRGRADYVLRVNGELSWVLEAKSPVSEIQIDEIEQAWTYACHPEVRAAYFALCNGREFRVYDSMKPADSREVLRVSYEDFTSRYSEILHVVGPLAIERQIALRAQARGTPLGPGLGSVAQIASGLIRYFHPGEGRVVNPNLQTIILGGSVERDDEGRVVVHIETQAPLPGMQEINERIGFKGAELRSQATALPLENDMPLELSGAFGFTIPEGEEFPNPANGTKIRVPQDLVCEMTMTATGQLDGLVFRGDWVGSLKLNAPSLPVFPLAGTFFARLV